MTKFRRLLAVPIALAAFACNGDPTRPAIDPTACASASNDPTVGCARIDARILYSSGQPAPGNVGLEQVSDTARYRVHASTTDSTGRTIVEVQRRYREALDTATVTLQVQTPPASMLGSFFCLVTTARLHFAPNNAVPDTSRVTWTLATVVASGGQCSAATSASVSPNGRSIQR